MRGIYDLRNHERYRVSYRVNPIYGKREFTDFTNPYQAVQLLYEKYDQGLNPQLRVIEL